MPAKYIQLLTTFTILIANYYGIDNSCSSTNDLSEIYICSV